ncbi:MAG: copper chaperone PCu(A)C [Bacteroidota bacterium]
MPSPMNRRSFLAVVVGSLLVVASLGSARADDIAVETAWARASVARTGAAFVTVSNTGDALDRLVAVASPVAADINQ